MLRRIPLSRGLCSRAYPQTPTVAVAVTVVRRDLPAPQFLLAQRAKAPCKGSWSIPGGGVELGEALTAAGARELQEETGLVVGEDTVFKRSLNLAALPLGAVAVAVADARCCQVLSPRAFTTTDAIHRDESGEIEFHYLIAHLSAEVDGLAARKVKAASDVSALRWFTMHEVTDGDFEFGGDVGGVLAQLVARDSRSRVQQIVNRINAQTNQ